MANQNSAFIPLWARLGVSLNVTPQELEVLRRGDKAARKLLVSLIQSDRCVLDGETYFPDMANEKYLPDGLEFDFTPTPLHSTVGCKIQTADSSGDKNPTAGLAKKKNKRAGR